MSQYSNRAGATGPALTEYAQAIIDLLGDRDPVVVLSSTPQELRSRVNRVPKLALMQPEDKGKWSIAEVLQHLADSETVWAYRLRRVLAEDRPVLAGYDQDLWAERFAYRDAPATESLSLFEACRRGNVRLLSTLGDDDLKRVGVHSERGEETVSYMLGLYAGHDLVHLRQVDRIIASLGLQ